MTTRLSAIVVLVGLLTLGCGGNESTAPQDDAAAEVQPEMLTEPSSHSSK
jgi:hypothetical protein